MNLWKKILEDDYQVSCVSSGKECIKFIKEHSPDMLLLDVAMPQKNGYEVCEEIKAASQLDLPIIFVSARGSLEERLAGYESGGDDYLVKPFSSKELLAKVDNMVTFLNKNKALNSELEQISDMAILVMSDTSKLSAFIDVTLSFIRQAFYCQSITSLCKLALDALSQFGLLATIQVIDISGNVTTVDSCGLPKPGEIELLKLSQEKGRIFKYKQTHYF